MSDDKQELERIIVTLANARAELTDLLLALNYVAIYSDDGVSDATRQNERSAELRTMAFDALQHVRQAERDLDDLAMGG